MRGNSVFPKLVVLFVALFVVGRYEIVNADMTVKRDGLNLAWISDRAIESIGQKKIYFGHASVGKNIVDGLKDIQGLDPRFRKIRIVDLQENTDVSGPGFYHSVNGKNGYPNVKCDAFQNRLALNNLGKKLDIAFFKFCYVDITPDTDVQEMFDYYVRSIERVKKNYPRMKIVHVTAPLSAHAYGIRGYVKSLFSKDLSNIKRNQFNNMLLNKYKNVDPIFDLAKVEYELENGETSKFTESGNVYHSLANRYTYDGGHLNENGRMRAAKELIRVLSKY